MEFPTPLVKARLLRRYKRFLSDALLLEGAQTGREITAHCANPGAMTGMAEPGSTIWLAHSDDPRRKLAWSWKLTELPDGHFVGVDAAAANRIVGEALEAGRIPALAGYPSIRREAKYGERSRVDFLLSAPDRPDCYVEVKSVTLRRQGGLAEFPDARTARGARHLAELAAMVGQGARAVMLYVVQRADCARVAVAGDIDPAYATAFRAAREAGVEVVAHGCAISPACIILAPELPFQD